MTTSAIKLAKGQVVCMLIKRLTDDMLGKYLELRGRLQDVVLPRPELFSLLVNVAAYQVVSSTGFLLDQYTPSA